MEHSADPLFARRLVLRDCYGMIATILCWLLLSGALALATLRDLPVSLVAEAFVSMLCGPFAFFDAPSLPWASSLLIALFCVAPILLHLLVRQIGTAILAGLGISWWFLIGMGLTFISV